MSVFRLAAILGMLSAQAQSGWTPCFYPIEVRSEHGDFTLADAMIDASGRTLKATVTGGPRPRRQAKCSAAVTIVTQHVNDPMERRIYEATVDRIDPRPGAIVQFRMERDPIKLSSFSQLRGILADVSDCAIPHSRNPQAPAIR